MSAHLVAMTTAWRRCAQRLIITAVIMLASAACACGDVRATARPEFLRLAQFSSDASAVDAPPAPLDDSADTTCPGCLSSFWIVNTRCLPTVGCCGSAQFSPEVSRYECGQGCTTASLDELLATDDHRWFTVVYIHGNLTSHSGAIGVCNRLRAQLPERVCSGQPVRLILWSWPSDCDAGSVRDTTAVAGARAATESYYFARFSTQLNRDQRLLVVGYSFGARVTTGALHLLAGCPLGGRHLIDEHAHGSELAAPRMRAVLLAAAIDVDWLIPGHFHGAAMQPVERVAITVNPRDIVLKTYRVAEKRNAPEPVGKVGPPFGAMGNGGAKIVTQQVTGDLGRRHGSNHYFSSPQVISLIRCELRMFDDGLLVARRK